MNKTTRKKVWNKTGGRCYYCGCKLVWGGKNNNKRTFCVEHIRQNNRRDESTSHIDNLVPSCKSCNSTKSNNDLETFRERLAYRSSDWIQMHPFDLMVMRQQGYAMPSCERYTFYFEKIGG